MPKVRMLVDHQGYPCNSVVDAPAKVAKSWVAARVADDNPDAVAAGGAAVPWKGGVEVEPPEDDAPSAEALLAEKLKASEARAAAAEARAAELEAAAKDKGGKT